MKFTDDVVNLWNNSSFLPNIPSSYGKMRLGIKIFGEAKCNDGPHLDLHEFDLKIEPATVAGWEF